MFKLSTKMQKRVENSETALEESKAAQDLDENI